MIRRTLSLVFGLLAVVATAAAADPLTVTVKTLRGQMRYSETEIAVAPGQSVKLVFTNDDDMPHNMVFCKAGTDVAAMAAKQLEKPEEAIKRNFLPDDPAIWLHTKLVDPHQSDELAFEAPQEPGDYPFVCTMPGHALSMKGTLRVLAAGKGLTNLKYKFYNGSWTKLPDFAALPVEREGTLTKNLVQIEAGEQKEHYGIVFSGELQAEKGGEYVFELACDDGARLLIDGKKIVEGDGIHPSTEIHEGKAHLDTGSHRFELAYFQAAGGAELYVAWKGPNFALTPLSSWVHPEWKSGGRKKKDEHVGMPLVVKDEPILYRNFISGAGDRGIGVGYPSGFNLAWSAEVMNLAVVWRGAFIDAARHWTDRGGGHQPPLGYDAFEPVNGLVAPLAIAPSGGAPAWQKIHAGQRAEGFQWKGYRLDPKRFPTFFYEWNGVKVSDRFDIEGDAASGHGKLNRTVTLEGAIPAGTMFLVASGKSVQTQGADFLVDGGRLDLDGVVSPNVFTVSAPGATIAGNTLALPAKAEIKISYGWPTENLAH